MSGFLFRALAMLCLIGMSSGLNGRPASAQTAHADAQFDLMIAEAKSYMLIDPARTIIQARAAQAAAERLPGARRAVAIATAKWLQGEAYLRLNDLAHAGRMIDEAAEFARNGNISSKLNGDILLSKASYDTAIVRVADALAAYQQAHNIFRDIGETRSQAIALVSIALLYQEAEDYKNALKYYSQALDVYHGDKNILFSIHGNRGNIFSDLNEIPQAQVEFTQALKLAREMKSPILEARTLRNLARGQLNAGQLDAADHTIALGFRVAQGNESGLTANHFLVLSARSAQLRGRSVEAQRLIAQVFASVNLKTTPIDLREAHLAAYDIYKKAGNAQLALAHLEALKRIEDETSKLAASANTALAAARFDFANQELNIEKLKRAQLQRNIDDEKLRARTQRTIFGGLAGATGIIVALLALGLVTIRRSRNDVRAANVDLARTNDALGKALAAKTEFLATTSHEIRTPLNGILGMTQVMLADRTLSEALRDRIGVVHGAGVTMRALVDDILDVAKMETGKLTIERVPFDLRAMLRDVARMWEEQARAKGLRFVLDLDDCPAFIEGDAARLRQIAFNLLSNALKFTETGQVTVRAATDGARLRIAVGDTGIGIPRDKHCIIFESFRQVDAGTTRRFGGTGLGLAICRNLARAMAGDVVVTSMPGHGSTFTLDLPLLLAPAPEVAAGEAAGGAGALLILDRNPISRAMLRAVLEARAGAVVFASTPDEAVARIAAGGIARVLIDDATLKAADDVDAALAALGAGAAPSALLWPAPSPEDAARFAAAGIDRVIAKPIAGAALAANLFDPPNDVKSVTSRLVTQAA